MLSIYRRVAVLDGHSRWSERRRPRMPERNGFTLVEMLIVIGIICVLSAIAIPGMLRSRMEANEVSAIQDVREAVLRHGGSATITCPSPPSAFSTTKAGYMRGCTVGVYWATPLIQNKTGVRGFASDASARVCFTTDGSIPNM